MKRKQLLSVIGLSVVGLTTMASGQVPPDAENPGSLFPKKFVNPFMDRTAKAEGDVVTILISESSLATFAASTTTSKNDKNAVTELLGTSLFKGILPSLTSAATSSGDGKGSTTQSGRLSAKMAAVVKKVLPNGNLLIEGVRQVRVNKDTQTFFLTGIIRPDDVISNNTIMSENIAEAEIRVDGKGQISERTRKGIITRIIDWLF
jgi:flagellar L-ring protein precursor FlgH